MNIEFATKINDLIQANQLDAAIDISEKELRQLPKTEFYKLIGWDQTSDAEALADQVNIFYNAAAENIKTVGALYCEMNGFTINYDMWYVEFFAFTKFQGLDDLDWLADFDYNNLDLGVAFTGIEEILAVFKDYMENERWNDSVQKSSFEIAEILVILRVQQLFREAAKIARSKKQSWINIPFLMTAHDYDLIYNVTGH